MSQNCRFIEQRLRGQFVDWADNKRKKTKATYKHIPHREKAPHLVAQRNARERRRVQAVNSAFLRLRKHVPMDSKSKRLSKVRTLQTAIDYISRLKSMIERHDRNQQFRMDYTRNEGFGRNHNIRWISLGSPVEEAHNEPRPCCMYANYSRTPNHSSG